MGTLPGGGWDRFIVTPKKNIKKKYRCPACNQMVKPDVRQEEASINCTICGGWIDSLNNVLYFPRHNTKDE